MIFNCYDDNRLMFVRKLLSQTQQMVLCLVNQEGPLHQISGILVSKLPLLSKSAGFSLDETCCQVISSLFKILLTLFRTNWLKLLCQFNRCNTICLSIPLQILHFEFLKLAAKNTVIPPNFLAWKFCGKAQFPHSFGSETVPFHKISTPGN